MRACVRVCVRACVRARVCDRGFIFLPATLPMSSLIKIQINNHVNSTVVRYFIMSFIVYLFCLYIYHFILTMLCNKFESSWLADAVKTCSV